MGMRRRRQTGGRGGSRAAERQIRTANKSIAFAVKQPGSNSPWPLTSGDF